MGIFTVKARFYNPGEPERSLTLEVLVDTGATFSGLPAPILRDLGIEPEERGEAILADGRKIEREYAIIGLELEGKRRRVPVAFKEDGSKGVIGATALEILGFSVDLIERKLVPKPPLD